MDEQFIDGLTKCTQKIGKLALELEAEEDASCDMAPHLRPYVKYLVFKGEVNQEKRHSDFCVKKFANPYCRAADNGVTVHWEECWNQEFQHFEDRWNIFVSNELMRNTPEDLAALTVGLNKIVADKKAESEKQRAAEHEARMRTQYEQLKKKFEG